MGFKELKKERWFKIATNAYVLVLTLFVIWMTFFDTNSFLLHRELRKEHQKQEELIDFLKLEIEKNKRDSIIFSTPEGREKYAREKFFMKKANEEVFIIEHEDSLKVRANE